MLTWIAVVVPILVAANKIDRFSKSESETRIARVQQQLAAQNVVVEALGGNVQVSHSLTSYHIVRIPAVL